MRIKSRFYFLQNKNKRKNNMHKIGSCCFLYDYEAKVVISF